MYSNFVLCWVSSLAAGDAPVESATTEQDLSLDEQERRLLVSALERSGGNQSQAVRLLRVSCDRIRYKMSKHHLK